jgi:FKBP-type peptidyl-prolyl cis-trans isomerase SlpA
MSDQQSGQISAGETATIHLRIATTAGVVVEETFGGEPLSWTIGDGTMASGIEERLIGLQTGMSAEWHLDGGEIFGVRDEGKVQWMDRDDFPLEMSEQLEPGLVVAFRTPNGEEWPGRVVGLTIDRVEIDFNHPLADREIVLSVEVLGACRS